MSMSIPDQLMGFLKESTPEIDTLQKEKIKIKIQLQRLEEKKLKDTYNKFTVAQIKSIWEKASQTQKLNILESVPEIVNHIEKLESYGGLNYDEIISEIIESQWNKSQWLEDMDEYFEMYCKGGKN